MTVVTVEGRVGGDPDLRFISTGKAVASFSIVSDRRRKNPTTDEWESTETTWRKVTAWGDLGENCTNSLQKGDLVIVIGREYLDEWQSKDGKTGVSLVIEAYNVGPALKRSTWKQDRAERVAVSADDPWNTSTDEAPF
jgi:single-strand DNA-binding protein